MSPTNEDSAYDRLRAEILSLELVPGERLSERGLEAVLGASRTPIRAALMRLENEGLTQRAGRGWQVTPIDLTEVRAVMEYREAIESAAVTLAVERADDGELDALLEIAEAHRDRDDEETGLRDGGNFHVALARLSRNRFLVDGMAGALTRLSRTRWLEMRSAEARAQARDEHVAIVTALKAGDPDDAVARVVAHNRGTRDRLLAYLTDERRRLRGRGFSIVESETPDLGYPPPMATQKQKAAARRNVKKAQAGAKQKKTLKHLSKSTKTALGKEANKVREGDTKTRKELEAEARKLDIAGRSKMGKDELRKAIAGAS